MSETAISPLKLKQTPAAAFMMLLMPFGMSGGYVSVTLGYMLAKAHMPTAAIAVIISFNIWPQTLKVVWAPMVDTTLSAKTWYVIGAALTGLSILGLSVVPATITNAGLLTVLVIVCSLASTLVSQSSEVIMAHGVPDERKGAVSGWSQGGGLGGSGVGGGIGLYVAQHVSAPWVSGGVLALLCIACCGGLFLVNEPVRAARHPHYVESLKELGIDVWSVASSRLGLLVLLLMLLPIGSGGASNLFSAIATEWHAGVNVVEIATGVVSGFVTMGGAIVGGYACDRMDRRSAYCVFGVALAAVAVIMALAPRTPTQFIVWTLGYAAVLGACYAAYSASVLEAIGKGAAATKFNLLASVSNIPIAVMTTVDGSMHDRHGTTGMLFGEAALAVLAVLFFMAFARLTRGLPPIWRWFGGGSAPAA